MIEQMVNAHVKTDPLLAEVILRRSGGESFAKIADGVGYAERTLRQRTERLLDIALVPLGILHHDAWLSGFWASCHLSCCLGYEVGSPCEESFVAAEVG